MSSDGNTFERLLRQIAELERQNGRVPTIRELSRALKMKSSELRDILGRLLAEEKSDGTSAFGASLRDILFRAPGQQSGERVNDHHVHLLDHEGTPLGIVPTKEALLLAGEKGLDLFLVEPEANPPVAQIMEFGRFKVEQEKRMRAMKQERPLPTLKELKMIYKIHDHDYDVKLQKAQKFLEEGGKVKFFVLLEESEPQHAELATELFDRISDDLAEFGVVDEEPLMDGDAAVMTLSPSRPR